MYSEKIYFFSFFVLLLLNFIFIFGEVAISEVHKSQIEKLYARNEKLKSKLLKIINEPIDYLTVMEMGSLIVNFFIGLGLTIFIINLFKEDFNQLNFSYDISFKIAFIVITTIAIISFVSILARHIATHNPPKALKFSSDYIILSKKLSLPFIILFRNVVNTVLLIFGVTPNLNQSITEDEVKDLIEKATEEGTFEKVEQDMVDRIFHMSDQSVYALMTPRTSMEWLDIEDPLYKNIDIIKKSSASFFILGKDNLDEIIGVVYLKDIANLLLDKQKIDFSAIAKKPIFVPRSMESFKLLEKFRKNQNNEAIVLDEYGGVIGFITIFDIINEVLGDISSNSLNNAMLKQENDTTYVFDGLYPIDDFKEKFQIEKLPKEDQGHYKTMGGFLTATFGYLPEVGEKRIWQNYTFEIISMEKNRIGKIKFTIM